jgi:phage anti-repressor protein
MPQENQNFNLISVKEKDGKQLVDARELHNFLEVKRDFSNWIKYNIERYGFIQDQDYSPILARVDGRGKNAIDYALTVDMAKELSMVSRTKKGKEARTYFINIEKKYTQGIKPQQLDSETSKLFNTVLAGIKEYSPTAAQTVGVKMLQALGIEVPYNALPLVVEQRWSATEIANVTGLTANMIGRTAKRLDLRHQPFAQQRMSIAPKTNKEITMYYYNQRAKEKIIDYIRESENDELSS